VRRATPAIMIHLLLIWLMISIFEVRLVKTESYTITVPDDFPTIQDAVNNVIEGGTIFVRNGTYYEHVEVNKSVSLIGESKYDTILDGNRTGSVFYVTDSNVNITGFTIQKSGMGYLESGIYLNDSSRNNINYNILRDNQFGICLSYNRNSNFIGNILSARSRADSELGMWLFYSSENTLINNTISNNRGGIMLYMSHNNTLIENMVSDNNHGILLSYSKDNILINNIAIGEEWSGISISDSSHRNMLINNTASNNLDGINLGHVKNNVLFNNIVSHNRRTGISVGSSSNNRLIRNRVINNGNGIEVQSFRSINNSIYHNSIINNTRQAFIILSPVNTKWDNGYPSGGNFWSDYDGADLYSGPYQNETGSDGIGDIPYVIYNPYVIGMNNTDNYPLINPLSWWSFADVNYDFEVNIYDVVLAAVAFNSTPSDIRWNPHCDIAEPYGIIDIFDIVMIIGSYGEEY